jgi:hypothetical protein
MAISSAGYTSSSSNSDRKLEEKLRWSFGFAFDKNKEFEQLEGVKTIADWYKEGKEYKEERQKDGDNKHTILSLIANRIIDQLVKHVEPYYKDSIINSIGVNTHFKKDDTKMNFNVGFISLKPFVKFVKQVNEQDVTSATFRFQLDTSIDINKLEIHASSAPATIGDKSIDIEKLGIEMKLSLLQLNISSMRMPVPVITLNQPIKLLNIKFEIDNLSFSIKHSSAKVGVLNSLAAESSYDKSNNNN